MPGMYQAFAVILSSTKNKEKKKAVGFLFILFYVYKCFLTCMYICISRVCSQGMVELQMVVSYN